MQRPSYSHTTTLHWVYSAHKLNNSFQLIQLTYRISTKSVHPIHSFSRDGVVGVATRPRDGRPRNRGSIPGSVRYFSLFSHVQLALKPPTQWVREVCVCVCVCVCGADNQLHLVKNVIIWRIRPALPVRLHDVLKCRHTRTSTLVETPFLCKHRLNRYVCRQHISDTCVCSNCENIKHTNSPPPQIKLHLCHSFTVL